MEKEINYTQCSNYILTNSISLINNCLLDCMTRKPMEISSIVKDISGVLMYCIEKILFEARIYDLDSELKVNVDFRNDDIVFSYSPELNESFIVNAASVEKHEIEKQIRICPVKDRVRYYIVLVFVSALIAYLKDKEKDIGEKTDKTGLKYGEKLFHLLLALFGNLFIDDVTGPDVSEPMALYVINKVGSYADKIKANKYEEILKFIVGDKLEPDLKKENLKFEYILLRMHEWYLQKDNSFIKRCLLAELNIANEEQQYALKEIIDLSGWDSKPYVGFYNLLIESLNSHISVKHMLNRKKSFSDKSFLTD